MATNDYEAEEIYKLDLEKYGLSHLEGKDILSLSRPDMEALLTALGNDDVSLTVSIPCTPEDLFDLTSTSECRRCGKCCQPNPLNPESPGIEIFREELSAIADYLHVPYESLEQKTNPGKYVPHPFRWTGLSETRWMPLPCLFYDTENNTCTVHSVRPVVCRIHPVIFTGYIDNVSIKLNCEYGKELVIKAYERVKEKDPGFEVIL